MAQSMIQAILQLLQDGFQNSTIPVIPAYSRKPVPPPDCKQPYGIYSIQQLQVQKPVVRKETCYYALEAELHLTLCAPDSFSGLQCFSLLQEELLPKILALPCVFTGYTTQHPQTDAKLRRMLLTAVFTLHGVWESDLGGVSIP